MKQPSFTLGAIATELGAELRGNPDDLVTGLGTLERAGPGQLSFLANPNYARHLAATGATAVILAPRFADQAPASTLVLDNPYLGYARISHWFDTAPPVVTGVHPSAVVDPSATVPASASVGPQAFIDADVVLGENVVIGAGCIVGARCCIGDNSLLRPRVTLGHEVTLGARCHILSGAVLGSDGFGFANEGGVWHRIAQIGRVILGDDVEIGANTTVDRGALGDTVIGNGVKIDNLVQISHNVQIGEHTAMAGKSGIAGSTRVGRHCVFGGDAAVGGHLNIADGVHLTGMAMVTGNITEAGVYSSGTGLMPNRDWRKSVVRFRQLDELSRRLKELEKKP